MSSSTQISTLQAWFKLAGVDAALPTCIQAVAHERLTWMIPYAQTFLGHLALEQLTAADSAGSDPRLLEARWAKDLEQPCPSLPGISVNRMHGHLARVPFACAIAVALNPTIVAAHLIILAGALAIRAISQRDDASWYQLGLAMRKLAEPTRTGEPGYVPPPDLRTVDTLGELLRRLDPDGESDREGFVAVTGEAQYQQLLLFIHARLNTFRRLWLLRRPAGPSGHRHRIRGPRNEGLPVGLTWRPARPETDSYEEVPSATWRVAEAIEAPETDDHADADEGVDTCADADALVEQVFPPTLTAIELRTAVRRALVCHVAGIEPEFELDEYPEDRYASVRRVDRFVIRAWRRALRGLPRQERRWSWLGLILTVVVGIHPNTLRHRPLLLSGSARRSGLRFWKTDEGAVQAELIEQIAPVHQPFSINICSPEHIERSIDWRVLQLHPVIAGWLARMLCSLGAAWTPRGLRPPPGRWRPQRYLDALCERVERSAGLPPPSLGHLGGIHLEAIKVSGVDDPALVRLLAPTLAIRITPPMHYTRCAMQTLQEHVETVQVTAWGLLTGRTLAPPSQMSCADAVGSLRCATTRGIRRTLAILNRDARVVGTGAHDAQSAAAWINASVDRLVVQFTVNYGLRARAPIWGRTLELSAAYDFFSFEDKGRHRRSLPLDEPQHSLIRQLGHVLDRAAHPALGTEAFQDLRATSAYLLNGRRSKETLSLGHLVQRGHTWQWEPLTIATVQARLISAGLALPLQGVRHWARSTLVRQHVPPESIALLFGHHGFRSEEFCAFRHTSGPLLRAILLPAMRTLAREAAL